MTRVGFRLDPNNHGLGVNLRAYLQATGGQATLNDYMPHIKPEELRKTIFIACFPKSGSTFLTNALQALTGFGRAKLTYAYGQNEQELYLPALRQWAVSDVVVQQHCRASGPNIELFNAFRIRPVVLVRNIFDTMTSLHDFYNGGAFVESYLKAWPTLSEEGRKDCIIDMVAPWYLNFFAGWTRADAERQLPVTWMTYEDMIADKSASLLKVAEVNGLGATPEQAANAVRHVEGGGETRMNKGIAGRGEAFFSPEQRERVMRMTHHHPDIDFSMIGLPR